jgi:hypothetical protein
MAPKSGQRLARDGYWKVVQVPTDDDKTLVGRQLPAPDAQSALTVGFYPERTVIQITDGKLKGKYIVQKCSLHRIRGKRVCKTPYIVGRFE